MITPKFSLDQNDEFVILTVYAPFTNVADTEVFMEDTDLRFFSKPYFLRLHLPAPVEESDRAEAKYEADTQSFVIRAPKKNKGQFFAGLDMLTKLLTPNEAKASSSEPLVQEISAEGAEGTPETDWYIDQKLPTQNGREVIGETCGYGFAGSESDVFNKLSSDIQEILDVKDPDELTWSERRERRIQLEDSSFCSDHYLCDLFETMEIAELLDFKPTKSPVEFTKAEQEAMISLPRKDFSLLSEANLDHPLNGLLDIMFAYSYDKRTTLGEGSPESGWTIRKLSATLSCSERFESLKDTMISCFRRALIYPLYRHYDLTWKCMEDAIQIIESGRVALISSLLDIRSTMVHMEGHYLFNRLYIEPYAVWLQGIPEDCLLTFAFSSREALSSVKKSDLKLELDEIEHAAKIVMEEEESDNLVSRIENDLAKVRLKDESKKNVDSDDDSEDSDTTSSDETSDASEDEESSDESTDDESSDENKDEEKHSSCDKSKEPRAEESESCTK